MIGAPEKFNGLHRTGAVFVSRKTENGWNVESILQPVGKSSHCINFGLSVDVFKTKEDGPKAFDRIIVGAPNDGEKNKDTGSVQIFNYSNDEWVLEQTLDPPANAKLFGYEVEIDNEIAVVKAEYAEYQSVLYLYRFRDNKWSHFQTIDRPKLNGEFANAICLNENRLAVSCTSVKIAGAEVIQYRASILLFEIDPNDSENWIETEVLSPDHRPWIGSSHLPVAINGNHLAIGIQKDHSESNVRCGSVVVYKYEDENWIFETKLRDPKSIDNSMFGAAVSISDNKIIATTINEPGTPNCGATYFHELEEGEWKFVSRIESTCDPSETRNGYSVSISSGTAIVGEPSASSDTFLDGNAYFINLEESQWKLSNKSWRSKSEQAPRFIANVGMGAAIEFGNGFIAVGAPKADSFESTKSGVVNVYSIDIDGNLLSKAKTESKKSVKGTYDTKRLTALTGTSQFGSSITSNSEFLFVSDKFSAGRVFCFQRNGADWALTQTIDGNDFGISNGFGQSLAANDHHLVVGTQRSSNSGNGLVFIFYRSDDRWELQQTIAAHDKSPNDNFGIEVQVIDNEIAVGANGADNRFGAIYVFRFEDQVWKESQKLISPNADAGFLFGESISLQSDFMAVGIPQMDDYGMDSGGVEIYSRSDRSEQWEYRQTLFAFDVAEGNHFGQSVSIDGNHLLIGSDSDSIRVQDGGSAYLFGFDGETWSHRQKIEPATYGYKQKFGRKVVLRENFILIGAPGELNYSGSAYLFRAKTD